MGLRIRPNQRVDRFAPADRRSRPLAAIWSLALILATLAVIGLPAPVAAQTMADRMGQGKGDKNAKMFVEASELRYDQKKDTVAAEGNARLYYEGRTLEADRVVWDRKTNRVYAEGHARLTEANGTVYNGEKFDLTQDFRDGFIDSLRATTADKTYFSAPRVERVEGETTVFEKGTYTACAACKDDPDRPPLWRVRAKRIIHQNDERMIYYEDASLELLGIPIAYVPFFSTPDPTVTRKSGILSPHLIYNSQLGYGVGLPIFWALAPNYDLTVTPTALSKQGFLGAAEFRHRLDNGYYYIRATGIDELNPNAFAAPPYGSSAHRLRGSIESKGQFALSAYWKVGWEFTVLSDKWYLNDYHIPSQTRSSNYFSETTTTLYLTGQKDRGYFDLRGYHFEGLSSHDFQPQQPNVLPVLEYNRTFDVDPKKTAGIGGQVELDFNLTSLSARSATFQAVGPRVLDNAYNLYDVCSTYAPGKTNGSCLLRGIGGDYTRATAQVSWKRQYIDPIGEVWTPFAFARFNGQTLNLDTSRSYTFASTNGTSTYSNASQTAFNGGVANTTTGYVNPGVGLEYRYPFVGYSDIGSLIFEPIGQVIVRPNTQIGTRSLVNMDAQSLVFDDSNLFQWNKYSGYDRFETGIRANYGAQTTLNFKNGGYANAVFGQSAQVAGQNSYATPDAANVGLSSGLDTRLSDYVSAFTFAPSSALGFTAKGRFDQATFAPRRIDLVATYNFGALTGGVQYANYTAQPVIGYDVRREGLSLLARYKFSENYFAQGNVTFDMSRHLYPAALIGYNNPGTFAPAAFGIGGGYTDDCTTFSVNYSSIYLDNGSGSLVRNQTVLLQLQLRTLGDASIAQTRTGTASSSLDGVK